MAIVKFIAPTQPAESIGGLTLYKNGQQLAIRSRAYPKRVRSNASNKPKSAISRLSMFWEYPLSDAQRSAWGAYGFNTPLTDAYGNPRFVVGYAHFMRSNRPRYLYGLPLIFDGPATFGLPTYTLPTITMAADNATITITINPADAWANEDGGAMFAWASRPISRTRNQPPEVYRPLATILGSAGGTPAVNVATLPYTLPPTTPLRVFIRTSITRADGRLSGL